MPSPDGPSLACVTGSSRSPPGNCNEYSDMNHSLAYGSRSPRVCHGSLGAGPAAGPLRTPPRPAQPRPSGPRNSPVPIADRPPVLGRRARLRAARARRGLPVYAIAEGDEKPLRYPVMFRSVQLVVINKIDLLPQLDFD